MSSYYREVMGPEAFDDQSYEACYLVEGVNTTAAFVHDLVWKDLATHAMALKQDPGALPLKPDAYSERYPTYCMPGYQLTAGGQAMYGTVDRTLHATAVRVESVYNATTSSLSGGTAPFNTFKAYVTYGQIPENPIETTDFTTQSQLAKKSLSTVAKNSDGDISLPEDYNNPINVSQASQSQATIKGTQIKLPVSRYKFVWRTPLTYVPANDIIIPWISDTYREAILSDVVGKVNKAPWMGYDTGMLLCTGMTETLVDQRTGRYDLKFEFDVSKEAEVDYGLGTDVTVPPHHFVWFGETVQKMPDSGGKKQKPTTVISDVYVEKIYEEADFKVIFARDANLDNPSEVANFQFPNYGAPV